MMAFFRIEGEYEVRMVRAARHRSESEADIYHVVSRGTGRQVIFEDDDDRCDYLGILRNAIADHNGEILAWCLMDNHVHLLLRIGLPDLSEAMRIINSSYALRFNKKYGRVGHLMQGRFKSEPIDSDEYLLTAIRYIHQNPEKAGIAKTKDYRWSSYREYLDRYKTAETAADTSFVLGIIGDAGEFARFHETLDSTAACIDENRGRRVLDDESALRAAKTLLGSVKVEEVASLPKAQRDEALCKLKSARLSVRQIERLTGVPKSIVAKAKMGQ